MRGIQWLGSEFGLFIRHMLQITCIDPVHKVLGISLAAAQAIQLSASERNNGWLQFDPWAELRAIKRSGLRSHLRSGVRKISACASW